MAFNCSILKPGETPTPDRVELRKRLILEEFNELNEAHESGNIEHIAKEACDLVYVCLGTVLEFGWHDNENIDLLETGFGFDILKTNDTVEICASVVDFIKHGMASSLGMIMIQVDDYLQGMGLSKYFERCFSEVHRSNMSKLDENGKPVYREDGKVIKSILYSPADLSFLKQ